MPIGATMRTLLSIVTVEARLPGNRNRREKVLRFMDLVVSFLFLIPVPVVAHETIKTTSITLSTGTRTIPKTAAPMACTMRAMTMMIASLRGWNDIANGESRFLLSLVMATTTKDTRRFPDPTCPGRSRNEGSKGSNCQNQKLSKRLKIGGWKKSIQHCNPYQKWCAGSNRP